MARLGTARPVMRPEPAVFVLGRVRNAIDRIDDVLIVSLACRSRLARVAAGLKRDAGVAPRDRRREQQVRSRATEVAARLGMSTNTAYRLIELAITDACRAQGIETDLDQGATPGADGIIAGTMPTSNAPITPASHRLLRLLPPPTRLAPLLRVIPLVWQRQLLERAMARVLAVPLANGTLAFMEDRRLGIEVSDLGLRWVVELRDGQLASSTDVAEATVRGSATDLLLLASRLEDADTLFFQRRLVLTGDTELGLTARNLLDRLPWESVPLGLRIGLNRGARLARAARAVYRGDA